MFWFYELDYRWLVISLSTLAFRVSLYPVLIFQLKKMERIAELMPKCKQLKFFPYHDFTYCWLLLITWKYLRLVELYYMNIFFLVEVSIDAVTSFICSWALVYFLGFCGVWDIELLSFQKSHALYCTALSIIAYFRKSKLSWSTRPIWQDKSWMLPRIVWKATISP